MGSIEKHMIYPVILSGGSGTRLWPMSRSLYPKQLLALIGETSLGALALSVEPSAADAGTSLVVGAGVKGVDTAQASDAASAHTAM